jgi:hypothetical protein
MRFGNNGVYERACLPEERRKHKWMKPEGGWIKLYRKIIGNPLWTEKRVFSKAEAWIDILLNINHVDKKTMIDSKIITVSKGQWITSEVKLSKRWDWSRNKVRRFLNALKIEKMLTANGTANYTTLTVVNYEFYQGGDTTNDTANETPDGTTNGTTDDTTNETTDDTTKNLAIIELETTNDTTNDTSDVFQMDRKRNTNKNKEIRNKDLYTPDFETFYSEYPRAEEKGRTFTNWKKCLKEYSVYDLMTACRNYKEKVNTKKTARDYIKTSANFLGREKFFVDYIKGEKLTLDDEPSYAATQASRNMYGG